MIEKMVTRILNAKYSPYDKCMRISPHSRTKKTMIYK